MCKTAIECNRFKVSNKSDTTEQQITILSGIGIKHWHHSNKNIGQFKATADTHEIFEEEKNKLPPNRTVCLRFVRYRMRRQTYTRTDWFINLFFSLTFKWGELLNILQIIFISSKEKKTHKQINESRQLLWVPTVDIVKRRIRILIVVSETEEDKPAAGISCSRSTELEVFKNPNDS